MDPSLQEADRQPEDESPGTAIVIMNEATLCLHEDDQGVYVLSDNNFKVFSRMSMATSSEAVLQAQPVRVPRRCRDGLHIDSFQFLWFPCGVIRGGLSSMGIDATVQAEASELPAATFQIKTIPAKS